MNVKEYWQQLLWLGPENWGGLLFPAETDPEEGVEEGVELVTEDVVEGAETVDAAAMDTDADVDVNMTSPTKATKKSAAKKVEADEYAFLDNLLGDNTSKSKSKAKSAAKRDDDDDFDEDDDIDEDGYIDEYDREDGSDGYGQVGDDDSPRTPRRGGTDAEKEHDTTDPLLKSCWNMASYLPSAAAIYFKHIVGEYMLQYRKYRNIRLAKKEALLSSLSQSADTPREGAVGDLPLTDEAIDERVVEDMKNMLQRQLSSGLLRLVDELAMVYTHGYDAKQREQERQLKSPTGTGAEALPLLTGGTISPALEFVKATTHVLSLDSALEEEVSALKRMLLSQLRVREFNEDSQFKDPCVSYVLSDVICNYCSLCRDYDLLRDPVLSDTELSVAERWRCPNCHTAMNLVQVENRLLSEIDKMCTAFLVQDFRCPRTHAVSVRLCSPTSGTLALYIHVNDGIVMIHMNSNFSFFDFSF